MEPPLHQAKEGPANTLKRKRDNPTLPSEPPNPPPTSSEQRPIRRANRACNTCRRQKMRCDGPDSYPCSRCKNVGHECVFDVPPPSNKDQAVSTKSRIESLEETMIAMQSTQLQMNVSIQEILHELRRQRPVVSASRSISVEDSLDQWKTAARSLTEETSLSLSSYFALPGTSGSPLPLGKTADEGQRLTLATLGHSALPSIQSLLTPAASHLEHSIASSTQTPIPPEDGGNSTYPSSSDVPPHRTTEQSFAGPSRRDTWFAQGIPTPTPADNPRSRPIPSGGSNIVSTHETVTEQNDKGGEGIPYMYNASETREQPTEAKQPRIDARYILREDSGNRFWDPDDNIREFRAEDESFSDAIERGLLTEQEARSMFTLFYEHCHPRMPILDPKTDNFQSLRQRSPFCFCCVLMVAAKAQDGGNKPGELQGSLWDEAMLRAKASMFHRVKDLEVIQGLLLLSAWTESTGGTSWILAGHAIRCGVELGIHKSLGKLASETNNDESATRILVCAARLWCALYFFEYQLCLGIGRFTMAGSYKTVKTARETLLRNPFSNPNDMRLVFACEFMTLEYQILESLPNADADDPRCQAILKEGRSRMDTWHAEWDTLLSTYFSREHYMRQVIDIHRGYGYMTVHLACMPRNVAATDLAKLSECERENCFRAVSAARDIVKISVEKKSYMEGLQYSPPCFSGGTSFVGALLLRLGDVLSEEQGYALSLAEKLSHVLRNVPACRFKYLFMTSLKEHQQDAHRANPYHSGVQDFHPTNPTNNFAGP